MNELMIVFYMKGEMFPGESWGSSRRRVISETPMQPLPHRASSAQAIKPDSAISPAPAHLQPARKVPPGLCPVGLPWQKFPSSSQENCTGRTPGLYRQGTLLTPVCLTLCRYSQKALDPCLHLKKKKKKLEIPVLSPTNLKKPGKASHKLEAP